MTASHDGWGADGFDRQGLADELREAQRSRRPVGRLTTRHPDLTVEDAYAIQTLQTQRRITDGGLVRGHKVGLTSAAMQRALGVDQPDYGPLFADMVSAEFTPIDVDRYIQPRIEPEIAFVLGRRLAGPGVTLVDVVRAIDGVLPALEIIDSRIADWDIGLVDTIADSASSGGVVLGGGVLAPDDINLRTVGCNLVRNGQVVQTGGGGAVLGNPLNAVVWLANTLGAHGVALEEGHLILPGSCTAAVPVEPGDVITASFSAIGSVTAVFSRRHAA